MSKTDRTGEIRVKLLDCAPRVDNHR